MKQEHRLEPLELQTRLAACCFVCAVHAKSCRSCLHFSWLFCKQCLMPLEPVQTVAAHLRGAGCLPRCAKFGAQNYAELCRSRILTESSTR